jgi:uncharacterized protein
MSHKPKLLNLTKNSTVSSAVEIAETFSQRSKGLLGRKGLEHDHCLWIHRCNSIHTFFMKFDLDVLYVDKDLKVTGIHRNIKPWHISWGGFNSKSCFEFQSKALDLNLEIGDSLRVSA